ncbi:MAG: hypothetical protein RLZZ387_1052 [Chloroflexota bacterium]
MTDDPLPVGIDDLFQFGWVEDPRVSPDGSVAAFVRVEVDEPANRYRRTIWLVPLDGGQPRRFTAGARSDAQPRWSPDGRRLAFVSDRDGDKPQLYVIARDGGEARRITSLPQGVSDPAWSPDGARLAFLSCLSAAERAAEDSGAQEPLPADELDRRQAKERRARDEERRVDPRVVARLPYRSGTAYFDGRFSQLYAVELPADDDAPLATPRRLTDGDTHFGPPAWSPDSAALFSTVTRDPELDTWIGYDDVVRVAIPVEGRAEPERLTGPGFSYWGPLVSPDGRFLAVGRRPDDRPLFAGSHLALLALDGGGPIDLTSPFDRNVEVFRWLPNSDGVAFVAGWRGEAPVYLAAADDRRPTADDPVHASNVGATLAAPLSALVPAHGRVVVDFDLAPDGSAVFTAGSAASPNDLYLRRPDGSELRLTAFNDRLLASRALALFEELTYTTPDSREVQGWLLRPPGFDAGKTYPLAVHIHGGPHAMWGPGYRSMWHEWQAAAARGYIVFFCNPRGSDGYGEGWRSGVYRDWGGADKDILAGVEAVIARGGVDTARIGVTGGSYGGYMTAWLIGHSDRFACAVAARGVYNLLTEHSMSDVQELIELEFGGFPWELHDLLWQQSPLAHAHNITTPLLILHSELDFRVPIAEAEQLFGLLRRRNQVVELVRYPREGHELTRSGEPRHRADHMRRTLEWLDRYCKAAG